MAGRRTNLALLGLLTAALVTGGLAYGTGTGAGAWVAFAHGAAGLGMELLVPWKSIVVRRGLRRPRAGRWASIALGVLATTAVVTGVLFSTGLNLRYGPLNAMQVHVGSALLAIPLAVQHVWARPQQVRRVDLSRRQLLRAGGLAGMASVAWLAVEGGTRLFGLPGRRRRFTGSYERGSFDPQAMPATSWIDDRAPQTDPARWSLAVRAGADERRLALSAVDGGDEVTAVLDCTSGWWSEQHWRGVSLARLLGDAPGRSIVVKSATGYRRRFPRSDAEHLLLATRLGGEPLTAAHGAPARLVAPGRRGFWWVKWVDEVVVDDRPWWWQSPFPTT